MTPLQMAITVAACSVATLLTRFLPYLAFPAGKPTPRYVTYLGAALPGAVFGLLVIYCLKDVDLLAGSHGIPELACIALTAGTYLWRKNMLLSVFAGTIAYMLLVNLVLA